MPTQASPPDYDGRVAGGLPTGRRCRSLSGGYAGHMATTKQRAAAKRNVKKAQAGAKKKQTLKKLPDKTQTARGVGRLAPERRPRRRTP